MKNDSHLNFLLYENEFDLDQITINIDMIMYGEPCLNWKLHIFTALYIAWVQWLIINIFKIDILHTKAVYKFMQVDCEGDR